VVKVVYSKTVTVHLVMESFRQKTNETNDLLNGIVCFRKFQIHVFFFLHRRLFIVISSTPSHFRNVSNQSNIIFQVVVDLAFVFGPHDFT